MAFNIEMIKKVYDELKTKVDKARELTQSPLTLSEKILYSHLWNEKLNSPFNRSVLKESGTTFAIYIFSYGDGDLI